VNARHAPLSSAHPLILAVLIRIVYTHVSGGITFFRVGLDGCPERASDRLKPQAGSQLEALSSSAALYSRYCTAWCIESSIRDTSNAPLPSIGLSRPEIPRPSGVHVITSTCSTWTRFLATLFQLYSLSMSHIAGSSLLRTVTRDL